MMRSEAGLDLKLRTLDVRILILFCGLQEEGTEHQWEAGVLPVLSLGLVLYQERSFMRRGTQQICPFKALGPSAVGLWALLS